jgi:hypothetical protein
MNSHSVFITMVSLFWLAIALSVTGLVLVCRRLRGLPKVPLPPIAQQTAIDLCRAIARVARKRRGGTFELDGPTAEYLLRLVHQDKSPIFGYLTHAVGQRVEPARPGKVKVTQHEAEYLSRLIQVNLPARRQCESTPGPFGKCTNDYCPRHHEEPSAEFTLR